MSINMEDLGSCTLGLRKASGNDALTIANLGIQKHNDTARIGEGLKHIWATGRVGHRTRASSSSSEWDARGEQTTVP